MKIFTNKFMLILIFCCTVFCAVSASSLYSARDVSYTKEGWDVKNVNDAIDNLKKEIESKSFYYVGKTSSTYVEKQVFDCTEFPNYQQLTIDNFIFDYQEMRVNQKDTYTVVGSTTGKKDRASYNQETGELILEYWGVGYYYTSVGLVTDIYIKM